MAREQIQTGRIVLSFVWFVKLIAIGYVVTLIRMSAPRNHTNQSRSYSCGFSVFSWIVLI